MDIFIYNANTFLIVISVSKCFLAPLYVESNTEGAAEQEQV